GARLDDRPPAHGRARPARPALGPARALGAARRRAKLPRAARALRRRLADGAEPAPGRAARVGPDRARAGLGLRAHGAGGATRRGARSVERVGEPLGPHLALFVSQGPEQPSRVSSCTQPPSSETSSIT